MVPMLNPRVINFPQSWSLPDSRLATPGVAEVDDVSWGGEHQLRGLK
jgi:hypothetical protein